MIPSLVEGVRVAGDGMLLCSLSLRSGNQPLLQVCGGETMVISETRVIEIVD